MTVATARPKVVSTAAIATRHGIGEAAVRRVLDRTGLCQKVGRYRVVFVEDLDAVELALVAAGCLKPKGQGGPPC